MTEPENIVTLVGAQYVYPTGDAGARPLGPYSMHVRAAEMVGVVGPSGSGKSTLLGLLGGLIAPTTGTRAVGDGHRGCAFVLQSHAVHPYLTAWENVATAWGLPRARQRERAERVLRAFALDGVAARRADRLSGGQRQRLAVARAVASRSSVIIADEPTGNLDVDATTVVLDALESVARNGRAIVVATHDPQVRARCTRVVDLFASPATSAGGGAA